MICLQRISLNTYTWLWWDDDAQRKCQTKQNEIRCVEIAWQIFTPSDVFSCENACVARRSLDYDDEVAVCEATLYNGAAQSQSSRN